MKIFKIPPFVGTLLKVIKMNTSDVDYAPADPYF